MIIYYTMIMSTSLFADQVVMNIRCYTQSWPDLCKDTLYSITDKSILAVKQPTLMLSRTFLKPN